jgi:hypothetical protein
MRCLPELTRNDDECYWVTRQAFFQHFDQNDFLCRKSADVTASYLSEWFHTPKDGILHFMLPTIQFVGGKTQFINGRHRTAVLLPYLDELPFAFALSTKGASDILHRLALRPLRLDDFIELPDLPIVECLS